MIDKKELRYGNLLKHGDRVVTVEEIGDDGINICWMHEMTCWDYDYKNLEPIILTPEWLIKLGFKKQSGGFWFLSGGYYVIEGKDGWHLSIGGGLLSKVVIKSIHQLQNYYFVHQNKELELKNN